MNLLSQDQHSGNPEEAGIHKVWAGLVIDDQHTKVHVGGHSDIHKILAGLIIDD